MGKKILFLYPQAGKEVLFQQSGVVISTFISLLKMLEEKGHKPTLNGFTFADFEKHANPNFKTKEGNAFQQNPNSFTQKMKKYVPSFIFQLLKEVQLLRKINQFNAWAKTFEKPDCLIEFSSFGSNCGSVLSKYFSAPLIFIYDSPLSLQFQEMNGKRPSFASLFDNREIELINAASKVMVYSKPVGDYVEKMVHKKVNLATFQVVDYKRLTFLPKRNFNSPLNIGFVGSFLDWHRVDLLISVFEKLKSEGYDIRLILIGSGKLFSQMKEMVSQKNLTSFVEMPGFVSEDELVAYKKQIDIGVMPSSNWYGAPMKLFEYGAANIASIAPSTPTIADMFEHEKEVLLFENQSFEGLYAALKRLLDNPALLQKIADNLHEKIKEKYKPENYVGFYAGMVEEVCK